MKNKYIFSSYIVTDTLNVRLTNTDAIELVNCTHIEVLINYT